MTLHALLGERCTDSEAGPEGPTGAWSGGQYSSGEQLVDWVYPGCVNRAQPMPETCTYGQTVPTVPKQCQNVPSFLIDMDVSRFL